MYGIRNFRRVNQSLINKAIDKLKINELSVDDILDEEEFVYDLKSTSYSQLSQYITKENLIKMLNYIIFEYYDGEDNRVGYKFPYNSCEILSSENSIILEKFFEEELRVIEKKRMNEEYDKNWDKDNKFKSQYLIEHHSKESRDEISQRNEENNENKLIYLEPDNNMTNKSEKLLIFNEINQNDDKENDSENINETIEENNEYPNVFQEQEQIPETNQNDKIQVKIEYLNKIENNEVPFYICDENYFSKEDCIKFSNRTTNLQPKLSLIDHLFQFIETEKPLNYVLTGYFAKIFINLLNFKTSNLIRYILISKRDFFRSLINHAHMKSISDIIIKLLNINLSNIDCREDFKKDIFLKIIDAFQNIDDEYSSGYCELLIELISNKKLYYITVKDEVILRRYYGLIYINNKFNREILKILTKLNELLLKDIGGTATSLLPNNNNLNFWMQINSNHNLPSEEESKDNYLENSNFNYIFKILSESLQIIFKWFNEENEFQFFTFNSKPNKILGLKTIYQLEYLKSILEITVNSISNINFQNNIDLKSLIELFVNKNFFSKIIDYFFIYEWNNLFQKAFESVILLIINKFSPDSFIKMIFEEIKLLDLFITKIFERSFSFESGRKIFIGNLSFICEITHYIFHSEHTYLKLILNQNEKWTEFYKNFIKPFKDKFTNGMQFQKEGFFDESETTTVTKAHIEEIETMSELYERCKETFLNPTQNKNEYDSNNQNASPLKDNFNYEIDLEYSETDASKCEIINSDYFDNNYWNKEIFIIDFEII